MTPIEQIKEKATITKLWHMVGLPGEPKVGMNSCPFHTEKTASFSIFGKDMRCHCFGCGAGGDVVDFYRYASGLDDTVDGRKTAVSRLCQMLGITKSESDYEILKSYRDKKVPEIKRINPNQRFACEIPEPYIEWALGKGIREETILRAMEEGALSFVNNNPHYHYNTGVKVRFDINSSKSSRWMVGSPQNGLWKFKNVASFRIRHLVMCEGESDTMLAEQIIRDLYPFANNIGVVGIPQSSFQPNASLANIIGTDRVVVLCFDNDMAGMIATKTLADEIRTHSNNPIVIPIRWAAADSKDVCSNGAKIMSNKFDNILSQYILNADQ